MKGKLEVGVGGVRGVCVWGVCGACVGRVWGVCVGQKLFVSLAPLYYPDTLVNPDTCLGIAKNLTSCHLRLYAKFRPPSFKKVRSHRKEVDRHMFGVFLYLVRVFSLSVVSRPVQDHFEKDLDKILFFKSI